MSNSHVIDKNKIVLGQCIRVNNVEKQTNPIKHRSDNNEYVAVQVEDYTGDIEYCILLTKKEYTKMETVELMYELFNSMRSGRIYPVTIANKLSYLLKVTDWENNSKIFRISLKQLAIARHRAINHPSSCTKKSVLTDLFD